MVSLASNSRLCFEHHSACVMAQTYACLKVRLFVRIGAIWDSSLWFAKNYFDLVDTL